MKKLIALAIAGTIAVSLSACAPKHATIEDCMTTYLDLGKPAEAVLEVCTNIFQKVIDGEMTQEEFDKQYLPK